MDEKGVSEEIMQDEGIIVETSLAILREGAKKVLFEFNETIMDKSGDQNASMPALKSGDTILFVENIPTLPARIVAVYIMRNFWYVNVTSETPRGGYPSGRDALKAAELDLRKLKILERFLIEREGTDHVRDAVDWTPDLKSEAAEVLDILKSAINKWHH